MASFVWSVSVFLLCWTCASLLWMTFRVPVVHVVCSYCCVVMSILLVYACPVTVHMSAYCPVCFAAENLLLTSI
jgi:hypothetical protein